MSKNGYQLNWRTKNLGYEWWWHSFIAKNTETGKLKPFFIEYRVINPGLWSGNIVLGQYNESKEKQSKPCYSMIKVGTCGQNKAQVNNFYEIPEFKANSSNLTCTIGNNSLTEHKLEGEAKVSIEEKKSHPEWMSDAGSFKWNLSVTKKVKYDVGYGSSRLFNLLNVFEMYWHIQGLLCEYSGEIVYNGITYIVEPETSYGYQDKNWGRDYTNPFVWLYCCHFTSKSDGKKINAGLNIGGGCPRVFGLPLRKRILTAFYYKNKLIEFNFSKFWKPSDQWFQAFEDEKNVYWDIISKNKRYKIEVHFKCEKDLMLLFNYESPKGKRNHNRIWNGSHATGTVKVYKKKWGKYKLIDELDGKFGGCKYGVM
ncbi:MAG: hypothetical protein MI922_26810 [Bacteroidales bacterium]|nr:hypothetical protein [Bacteroidales bacterium]